jgi:DNA-binding response OmpR family regulator
MPSVLIYATGPEGETAAHVLRQAGHTVSQAPSVDGAWAMLQDSIIDLFVMLDPLQRADCLGLLDRVRRHPYLARLPVLVVDDAEPADSMVLGWLPRDHGPDDLRDLAFVLLRPRVAGEGGG